MNLNNKYLVLDSRIIKTKGNVNLELGLVEKDHRNPLFVEEYFAEPPKRWEVRYDNLYPSVIYDNEDKLFKIWYNVFLKFGNSEETPIQLRTITPIDLSSDKRKYGTLYGFSRDGVNWIKPELGIITSKGSANNNIVFENAHGVGVFKDEYDPDPTRRYKAFFLLEFKTHKMGVAFSEDGIHFSEIVELPDFSNRMEKGGDTHNNAFWSVEQGKYVGITRGWDGNIRTVMRAESNDFINWSDASEIIRADDHNDQVYSMPVFYYGNVYIGLPAIFNKETDKVSTQLAWSPDTINWYRIKPGKDLIPLGNGIEHYPNSEYDCGCIYASVPIMRDGEILIYYGGSNYYHTNWREGSLNLAHLRMDGFAGYEANNEKSNGVIVTNEFEIVGSKLKISADVKKEGQIRVALLNKQGEDILGYSFNDSILVKKDVSDYEITWSGKDITGLIGEGILVKLQLYKAKIYSISGNIKLT